MNIKMIIASVADSVFFKKMFKLFRKIREIYFDFGLVIFLVDNIWKVELPTLIIAKIAEKDAHTDDDGRTIASEW